MLERRLGTEDDFVVSGSKDAVACRRPLWPAQTAGGGEPGSDRIDERGGPDHQVTGHHGRASSHQYPLLKESADHLHDR